MQAPSPTDLYSNISVQFGQVNQGPSQVDLLVRLFINSQKNDNIKFNVQEFLSQEIPQGSILIEIDAVQDGEELAEKIRQVKASSQSMKELETEKEMNIKIIGKGTKAYIIISGKPTEKLFEKLNQVNQQLEIPIENGNDHIFEIHAQSNSELKRVHQLVKERGTMIGFLQSLRLNFNFPKNQISNYLLLQVLPKAVGQIPNIQTMLKSFKNFNLKVKGQSSGVLENYPQLISSLKIQEFNDDFKGISSLLGSKIKGYMFAKPFSLSMSLQANNLYFILDVLFA